MRNIAFVALVLLLPAGAALAQGRTVSKPQPDRLPKTEPDKRAKPCAEYGPGFVRIEGSATCVQIRGYVRIEGRSR